MYKIIFRCISIILLGFMMQTVAAPTQNENPSRDIIFILNGSGSLLDASAARTMMEKFIPSLSHEIEAGLLAYRSNREDNCQSIAVLIPASVNSRDALLHAVRESKSKRMSPIADTIKLVSKTLKNKKDKATIVLLSNGKETCRADQCDAIRKLKKSNANFVLHVVGLNVNPTEQQQLACLADAGGGQYFSAKDTQSLFNVLSIVREEAQITRPLFSGKYDLIMAFANPNGRSLQYGAIVFNPEEALKLHENGSDTPFLTMTSPDNNYYVFKTKPLPAGSYETKIHYSPSPKIGEPLKGVSIKPGEETIVTLNSGIQLKKT